MKKKALALFTVIIVLSALSLIAFRPSSSPKAESVPCSTTEKATCCDKTMKDCQQKNKKTVTDDILVESLSRQFIFASPTAY